MSGNTRINVLASYKKAMEAMSANKGSASRLVPDDEIMITGSSARVNCMTIRKTKPSYATTGINKRSQG